MAVFFNVWNKRLAAEYEVDLVCSVYVGGHILGVWVHLLLLCCLVVTFFHKVLCVVLGLFVFNMMMI